MPDIYQNIQQNYNDEKVEIYLLLFYNYFYRRTVKNDILVFGMLYFFTES